MALAELVNHVIGVDPDRDRITARSFEAATEIAERISWTGSVTNLRRHVRLIRPD